MAKGYEALVTPFILKWARMLDNISVEAVAKHLQVKPEQIYEWENGTQYPTMRQAKQLAQKYRVPFAYFFLSEIPQKAKRPKYSDYRTLSNIVTPDLSREMLFLLRDIMERREVLLELFTTLGYKTIKFDDKINLEGYAEEISKYIRKIIHLTYDRQKQFRRSENALNYYINAFERLGIVVFQAAKIELNEMRGLSIYENVLPIIVINRKDSVNARIFTLFHELVHLLSRTPGMCNDTQGIFGKKPKNIEALCNDIAARILVPSNLLKQQDEFMKISDNNFDDLLISNIARNFAVSREVILGRTYEMGQISRKFYGLKLHQYKQEFQRNSKIPSGDGFISPAINVGTQVGKLYARTVLTAYYQDLITPKSVSDYFATANFPKGIGINHFSRIERWCF
jgi:Zn-dependent peptidase ImmA (M78 family)/DNA-binding XRE family transcriptional regulator